MVSWQRLSISAGVAFGLDRASKFIVVHWLDLTPERVVHVWPPFLNLVLTWNPGIDFGLLSRYASRGVLVGLAVAISIGLAAWGASMRGRLVPIAIGLAIGGALSNALDRVIYGAVMDYLNISCCALHNPYAFNVADILVVCGLVVAALGSVWAERHASSG